MIRGFCLTTLVALTLGVASHASAEPVELKFKFPDNRSATSEIHINMAQTLMLVGQELKSGSDQKLTVTTVNGKRANDGTIKVKSTINALKAEVMLPGGTELEFDSADAAADPPGTQFDFVLDIFKATAKSKWTSTIDQENHVVAIEGRADAFADLPQNLQDAMKAQIDPVYLKTAANDEMQKLPGKPVSQGDTWERTSTTRLDSGQKLTFTTKYTYGGPVAGKANLHKVATETTAVDYSADADAPLKVVSSELKVAESSGEIIFDQAAGQVVTSNSKTQIKGSLKLEIMGMELPGTLDLTMTNSIKLKP